jgi:hypothetical protein
MPGFGTRDLEDWHIFKMLMTAMATVHSYVRFRGVIYLDMMQEDRVIVKSEKILTRLYKFCGESYMPNVTIVTTKWGGLDLYGIQDKLERIDKWKATDLCSRLTLHGAMFHHHGLVEAPGEFETLRIGSRDAERKSRALAMIASRYGEPSDLTLQIYDEVANHGKLE